MVIKFLPNDFRNEKYFYAFLNGGVQKPVSGAYNLALSGLKLETEFPVSKTNLTLS